MDVVVMEMVIRVTCSVVVLTCQECTAMFVRKAGAGKAGELWELRGQRACAPNRSDHPRHGC
ncbi:hypothetical protein E2C01_010817 [Portunus trituberculatus]|uniref:Uncharacterized protein n=1 Tax=Portunus trituberculatus TaxID=210409 RepID=A0A5B7D9W8_PORTR|nr:hypothetical protein [Portunus trituberculatus]